jgi:hypothetical protein
MKRALLGALCLLPLASPCALATDETGLAACMEENERWQEMWQDQERLLAEAAIAGERDRQALRDAIAAAPEACGLLHGKAPEELLEDLGCEVGEGGASD